VVSGGQGWEVGRGGDHAIHEDTEFNWGGTFDIILAAAVLLICYGCGGEPFLGRFAVRSPRRVGLAFVLSKPIPLSRRLCGNGT